MNLHHPQAAHAEPPATEFRLEIDRVRLEAELDIPAHARGLVIFVHGCTGTCRASRSRDVAAHLRAEGFGTLICDLLSRCEAAEESISPHRERDVDLLSRRLVAVTRWTMRQPAALALRIGYFGSDYGGTAALAAAAEIPEHVDAIVARGSCPDLAGEVLRGVLAPTLLLVGGWDDVVLQASREALGRLGGERRLAVIPDATHRLEEPGARHIVAMQACAWFARHLSIPKQRAGAQCKSHLGAPT